MKNAQINQIRFPFSQNVKNYYPEILTEGALAFLSVLHEKFNEDTLGLDRLESSCQLK